MPELEHVPIEELIARWRAHPATSWDDIVGHAPQIRRLRELAALLRLDPAERARLRLRVGAGLVLSGAAGQGKTLLARAFAAELGRDVVAPPPGDLDAERIDALYRALAVDPVPVCVVLDEAGWLAGDADWTSEVDRPAQRALAAALDGIARPETGPVTIALTTLALNHLDEALSRPGRLSPRLELGPLTAAERTELLRRAVEGLPGADALRLSRIVERTQGWSGAEIAGLIPEALTRSLLDGPPELHEETLLSIVSERFVVRDPTPEERRDPELVAVHEMGGHCLYAYLAWGRGPADEAPVAAVELDGHGGVTTLAEWVIARRADRAELRRRAGMSLAGAVAEYVVYGREGTTTGAGDDRLHATAFLASAHELDLPIDEEVLEGGHMSRGSQAMRAERYRSVAQEAHQVWGEVLALLGPHRQRIPRLAAALLAAPERTLSGEDLDRVMTDALHGVAA